MIPSRLKYSVDANLNSLHNLKEAFAEPILLNIGIFYLNVNVYEMRSIEAKTFLVGDTQSLEFDSWRKIISFQPEIIIIITSWTARKMS